MHDLLIEWHENLTLNYRTRIKVLLTKQTFRPETLDDTMSPVLPQTERFIRDTHGEIQHPTT